MTADLDDTVIVTSGPRSLATNPALPDSHETVIVPRRDEIPASPVGPSPSQPVPAGRPSTRRAYYAFRLSSADAPQLLDVPCVVGRRPSAPRVPDGQPPRLVTVPSPLKEVSASHVEVRQRGSTVVVTDLRSTNGSVVLMPGSRPRKLRQGESVVVSPGTLVDIGDDNVLQILPMQHLRDRAERQP